MVTQVLGDREVLIPILYMTPLNANFSRDAQLCAPTQNLMQYQGELL